MDAPNGISSVSMFHRRRAELFPLAEEELIKPVLAQSPRDEQWPVFFCRLC